MSGGDDRRHLSERLPTERLPFHRKSAALVIGQQDSFPAQFLEQRLHLVVLELDDLPLLLMHPAGEGRQRKVPGLEDHGHGLR